MKSFTYLISMTIVAFWLIIIAIFSIQNTAEIYLKFLIFKSIKLPIGVLLSFCVGGGIILGSLAILLWKLPKYSTKINYDVADDF
ncbi:DUF1049 domain-containing protein [Cyanobacterium sp. uoEpiScrs1]|uniref:DUF1049 domain-containing protein n=1 Tax=Cyanobacterium sp. uoEpiScrs1 TaxID=2976343 RepID=UPI00226AF00B|nr:DUF1049 domain-containing protein [Cyanobacterium sp. uoEpiScrs1]